SRSSSSSERRTGWTREPAMSLALTVLSLAVVTAAPAAAPPAPPDRPSGSWTMLAFVRQKEGYAKTSLLCEQGDELVLLDASPPMLRAVPRKGQGPER